MAEWWILVGMMGSGKSTVGRRLASLAERPFQDTDTLLQNRFGRTISQVFNLYGEAAFRDHETSVLKGLQPEKGVLATGGGIVVRDENWDELRRLGRTIYLSVPSEVLAERLAQSKRKRPLLETENWEQKLHDLLDARAERYRLADLVYEVPRGDLDSAAQSLFDHLREIGWS